MNEDTKDDTVCKDGSMGNPLLMSWSDQPYQMPPFPLIQPGHFSEAFDVAMEAHLADLESIAKVDVNACESIVEKFESVIAAYDRAGALMDRVGSLYGNFCGSLNTPEMQKVQTEMSPKLARHTSKAYTLPGLFDNIKLVHDAVVAADSELTSEQVRLVQRIYLDFTRQGAHFSEEDKAEYADIKAELAELMTQFSQNVMKDEETWEMVLTEEDMAGCPDSLLEAAKGAAVERSKGDDAYVITLSRSLVEPFLTYSDRRDLREKAFKAWTSRGELSPSRDNLKIAEKMLKLRKRQAGFHGCKSFAEYQCQDRMAKTPENVMELLENVWEKAKVSANKEREAMEEYLVEIGDDLGEGGIEGWDWRYYAEKVRKAKYDFDESALKPYFSLEKVTEAVMAVSNKLFGLRYVKRENMPTYHPDVVTYEVFKGSSDAGGETKEYDETPVAVFIHDNYARAYKSSGAWMSEYRSQTKNLPPNTDEILRIPLVSNNNNFAKGKNTLLSFDDAKTLFHEMGHGHHGMLSDANYGRLASTNVLSDFVELPSQLMEHWLDQPEVLKEYARHYETNEPVPEDLIAKMKAAKSFNQGFATIEYTICALMDMKLHQIEDYSDFNMSEFEKNELARLGMPQGIVMRHRPAHFLHLFCSSSYAAGYYVYLWAEVLDADVFAAFEETGNVFDPATAEKARQFIYSAGNTVAPDALFRQFRGRDPDIKYMLRKKGLVAAE